MKPTEILEQGKCHDKAKPRFGREEEATLRVLLPDEGGVDYLLPLQGGQHQPSGELPSRQVRDPLPSAAMPTGGMLVEFNLET